MVTINSGAGGIEAEDWAAMLLECISGIAKRKTLRQKC